MQWRCFAQDTLLEDTQNLLGSKQSQVWMALPGYLTILHGDGISKTAKQLL